MNKKLLAAIFAPLSVLILADASAAESPGSNVSLKIETRLAMKRAMNWLASQQNEAGYWTMPDHPGLSGLVIKAFATSPLDPSTGRENGVVQSGVEFILSKVQPNGGIFTTGEGLANYNTSISLMALHALDDPDLNEVVRRARAFVVQQQQLGYPPESADYRYNGGVGYGGSYPHSDMVNTSFALQALYETRDLLAAEGSDEPELDWEAAMEFVSRSQNFGESYDAGTSEVAAANRGGFVYFPGDSKAGEIDLGDGKTALRSYGSVSYAGLLSFAYADFSPDDPRVVAVTDWLKQHFTLTENPGMDQQGLYYYFMMMATALDTVGIDQLDVAGQGSVNWREQLVVRLLELQDAKGFWQNNSGRWMENDPNLVTAYVLLALNQIYPEL